MINDDKVFEILKEKLKNCKCPMCSCEDFIFVEGHSNLFIRKNEKLPALGGEIIQVVTVICDNCGFVSQHALGSLGLLGKQNAQQNDRKEGENGNKKD